MNTNQRSLTIRHIQKIKSIVNAMIETESSYRGQRAQGDFWSRKNAGVQEVWTLWEQLVEREPEWIAKNFRFFLGERLSGRTPDIYDQYRALPKDQLLMQGFVQEYSRACSGLPPALMITERQFKQDEAFGVEIDGAWLSEDTARVQRYIANLYHCGALAYLNHLSSVPVILEIGGGYGMLAANLLNIMRHGSSEARRVKYVMVDFPQMIGFCACFLAIHFPEMRFGFLDPTESKRFHLNEELEKVDVLWIPHYAREVLEDLPTLHLALNTISFQEMSEKDIHRYAGFVSRKLDGYLYSDNMRRHIYNYDLMHQVRDILEEYFIMFPNQEAEYDRVAWTKNFIWETYVHVGTSKRRPVRLKYGDTWLQSRSHGVNLGNGQVEFYY